MAHAEQARSQKYTVVISRNPHDLLLQWLSGAGLDEEWEMGRHSVAGRAKAAINGVVVNRLRIEGTSPSPRASPDV